VDEINRSSPRTQAALLEAMGEGMITVERVSYRLQRPYMVIATQNPIEQAGTFALPEAQMDRFLFRLSLGYPELKDEKLMCERFQLAHPIDSLKPVTTPDRITECQQAVREVQVGSAVCDYLLALVQATRRHPALRLGASPRGSLGIFRAAQAIAAMEGRDQVSTADVKQMALAGLPHRVLVRQEESFRNQKAEAVIAEVIAQTPPPA
jgi:MoxR-like ATPase